MAKIPSNKTQKVMNSEMQSFVIESVTTETQTEIGGINSEVTQPQKEILNRQQSVLTEPLPKKKRFGFSINVNKLAEDMSGRNYNNMGQRYGGSNSTNGEMLSTIHESEPAQKKKKRIKIFCKVGRESDYSNMGASFGGSPLKKISSIVPSSIEPASPKVTKNGSFKIQVNPQTAQTTKKASFRINPETCVVQSPSPVVENVDRSLQSDESSNQKSPDFLHSIHSQQSKMTMQPQRNQRLLTHSTTVPTDELVV